MELIGYIEETQMNAKDVAPIFKMTYIFQLYTDRLRELGVDVSGRIHSTDLNNRTLVNVPCVNAYKQG